MAIKKISNIHNEWLKLIEISGPFLSIKVLSDVFPQGLNTLDNPEIRRTLKTAYNEFQDNKKELQLSWIKYILEEILRYSEDDSILIEGQEIPERLRVYRPGQFEVIIPDFVIKNPDSPNEERMLVKYYPVGYKLDSASKTSSGISPIDSMIELCRATGVKLGLVTNGDIWVLVHAPLGETSTFATWYANLWLEEPETLRAFMNLLDVQRFFGVAEKDKLENLFSRSLEDQQEVTDQLGKQVREAVEILVRTFDRIDMDMERNLLKDTSESEIYEASLAIMMRLVLMFCAEERGLFPLNNSLYNDNYALSTLRSQLRENADKKGEEVLERHHDAWSRLLATFRMVHSGVRHEFLELPAYGGSLFDPDKFPFLEGRAIGTKWIDTISNPLSVDNRTVLHLLEALQVLRVDVGNGKETRYLSFRSLDPEQIGHVYEGLLDHTVKKAEEPVLGIIGTTQKGRDLEPEIKLSFLEDLKNKGEKELFEYLKEKTGKAESSLKKLFDKKLDFNDYQSLKSACNNDEELFLRVEQFSGLIKKDSFEHFYVIHPAGYYVTEGTDRRSSGTHYTPRSLSEPVVKYTLEPLVYSGLSEGKPENEWVLKSPKELLALKICDIAMGSGAFLVQSCRFLAEKLVESWAFLENNYTENDKETSHGIHYSSLRVGTTKQSQDTLTTEENNKTTSEYLVVTSQKGSLESDTDSSSLIEGSSISSLRVGTTKQSQDTLTTEDNNNNSLPSSFRESTTKQSEVIITVYGEKSQGHAFEQLLPQDPEERLAFAKRLVATHCLYGVDKNHMAVEMAKLSLWLTTLDPNKPFTFLDHNLRCGDSLLGIADIQQLENFHLYPEKGLETHKYVGGIRAISKKTIQKAIELREKIESLPAFDIRGIKEKEFLLKQSDESLKELKLYADLLVGAGLSKAGKKSLLDGEIQDIGLLIERALDENITKEQKEVRLDELRKKAKKMLGFEPSTLQERKPFHWVLEFPEVFLSTQKSTDELVSPSLRVVSSISSLRGGTTKQSQDTLTTGDNNETTSEYLVVTSKKGALKSDIDPSSLKGFSISSLPEGNTISLLPVVSSISSLRGGTTKQSQHKVPIEENNNKLLPSSLSEGSTISSLRGGMTKQSQINTNHSGFNAIIGNPPFLGGKKITDPFGDDYREYIVEFLASGIKGNADLCAYFFLRINKLISSNNSTFGLISTNTIAQGDTREVALDEIVRESKIIRAIQSQKWPGVASLEVSLLWVKKGEWNNKYILDNKEVSFITPYLTEQTEVSGKPYRLKVNENKSFQGSVVLGMGFVLTPEEAKELIYKNPKNKDVLFPYLNGEDLNSSPTQEPSRWVINFGDIPLNRESSPNGYRGALASDYPDCLDIIEKNVKNERESKSEDVKKAPWWQFWRSRNELYSTIKNLDKVISIALTSRTCAFSFEKTDIVFSHATGVISFEEFKYITLLQSSIHIDWAWSRGSSMKKDLRYTPSDIFETFPFPEKIEQLEEIGEKYYEYRQNIMQTRQEGLTKTYNRFHNSNEKSSDIQQLRELHIEMDKDVAKAYDWEDLNLEHGFHETKQGIRFTVSEVARKQILDRLLKLNHTRYAEEVAQGLHDKNKKKETVKKEKAPSKPKKEKKKEDDKNLNMFDIGV